MFIYHWGAERPAFFRLRGVNIFSSLIFFTE